MVPTLPVLRASNRHSACRALSQRLVVRLPYSPLSSPLGRERVHTNPVEARIQSP